MSTADRPDASASVASDAAAACRDAGLVRLVGAADGDGLAAVGVLARALSAARIPFQASVARFPDPATGTDADVTVTVGAAGGDVALDSTPASVPAFATARELAPDAAAPVLALAGAVAAGAVPGEDDVGLLEAAREAGVERRPGLAVPVADVADGLAHSTLVHLPLSGDVDATSAALADVTGEESTPEARKRAASMVALRAVSGAPTRAAYAVERALRPYSGGAFETVGGYADVLDAVARERPGTGVALALGHDAETAALSAWREHARAAHRAVREADTGRYDGALVVRTDGPVGTVARLVRDYRSPEPVVLVLGRSERGYDRAAAAGDREVVPALRRAVADAGTVGGRGTSARARLTDPIDEGTFVSAFRGALGARSRTATRTPSRTPAPGRTPRRPTAAGRPSGRPTRTRRRSRRRSRRTTPTRCAPEPRTDGS